jgi:hypothetical protein
MTEESYLHLFDDILNGHMKVAPYEDEHYIHYVKMNQSRQDRWMKKADLTSETTDFMKSWDMPSRWIVITEPWCGDAAHVLPFLFKMSELNPHISLEIQLRDGPDSEIEKYLTNGGKAIPILVVRDTQGNDLFHWGPRPLACQQMVEATKNRGASQEELINAIQHWYNKNKGADIQLEIKGLLNQVKGLRH